MRCVRDLVQGGLDEESFRRARQQVKGALVMGQESSLAIMRSMGKRTLFFDEPFSIDESIAEIERVTLRDVNALLPEIFDTKDIGVGYVGKKPTCDIAKIFK